MNVCMNPREPPACGTCGGKGTITVWTKDRKGKNISYEKTCPNCGGTGKAW